MVVEAIVDRKVKVNFLVDTGASLTMIPTAAATELGISLHARLPTIPVQTVSKVIHVPLVVLDSVEVGGMEVKDLTVAVYDLPIFDQYLPGPPGLLGRDFLGNFRVQVDLGEGFLLLEDRSLISN
jgi:clan AA aspartic protease (TIGR02281 family)